MKLRMETSGNLPGNYLISNVGNFLHRISINAKLIFNKLNIK